MSTYQTIDAVELSQDELNMVEGGTFCLGINLLGGLVGTLLGGIKTVSSTLTSCPPPTQSYCPPPTQSYYSAPAQSYCAPPQPRRCW